MTCAQFLDRVRNLHPSSRRIPCLCTGNCGRYWERRTRTWLSRLVFWHRTVAGRGDWATEWVRLSRRRSEQIRVDEERGC